MTLMAYNYYKKMIERIHITKIKSGICQRTRSEKGVSKFEVMETF